MNPERYGDDHDYASGRVGIGMNMNVFSRIFEIRRNLNQIRASISDLKTFREQFDQGSLSQDVANGAMVAIKRLMRSLDSIEYAFPELRDKVWFAGFQDDVHGAYWRVEEGRLNGVFSLEEDATDALYIEVGDILANVSESSHTSPVHQLHRFLEHYGNEFYPYDAPDEYQKEVFEARDLFCLGYFSTGLIVLGRAVERALLQLGRARKIVSVNGFREHTNWEDTRFFERTKVLFEIDMPDESGKILTKRQYHQIQLLIDYRNQVAHNEYRQISKDAASRMMGQSLELLTELEEKRNQLEDIDDSEIQELQNVSIPL